MQCGSYGPEKYRYHTELGDPVVDSKKFPSLSSLTALAHSLNLTAGPFRATQCTDARTHTHNPTATRSTNKHRRT